MRRKMGRRVGKGRGRSRETEGCKIGRRFLAHFLCRFVLVGEGSTEKQSSGF